MAEAKGSKTLSLFIAAVVFGIIAAILSHFYIKSREAEILASLGGDEKELVTVLCAHEDLPTGLKIKAGYFHKCQIPSDYVPSNAISPGNFGNYDGLVLQLPLNTGKPLLDVYLDEKFPVDFSDLLSEGRRAITVQVDEVNSIAGFLRPGNHVDIYVNIEVATVGYKSEGESGLAGTLQNAVAQANAGNLTAATAGELATAGLSAGARAADVVLPILQDVKVLATGREPYNQTLDELGYPQRRSERNFTSITVDVTPAQAAMLAIADDKGDLIAILRNRSDRNFADFDGITPLDLFKSAQEMRKQAALRKAAAAAGATIDEDGNWVTADGQVIKKENIAISENGTVSTKDGKLLGAKGISVNENGEYVDADGNVIPPDELVFNADGTVTTKDKLMKAAGYTVNENGDYVDANGNVINKEDIIVNPDGTVTNKDAIMKAAGYTKNENGDYVDAAGNIVKKDDIKVLANGTVMTADGKVLSGPKVTVNKDGFIIAEDGTVMTADGKVLTGVTTNENGEVVGPDGTVLKDPNLTIAADGSVRDSSGNVIAGVTGSNLPPNFGEAVPDEGSIEQLLQAATSRLQNFITLIIGGKGKDGVALTSRLDVQPVAGGLPVRTAEEAPVEQ